MSTKVTIGINRIIHTELEGWPLHDTHKGKFDHQLGPAWNGQNLEEMVMSKWKKNAAFREKRDRAMKAYDSLKTSVDALSATVQSKDQEIAKLKAEVSNLKAQTGDTTKWETLKALIRELIGK